MLLAKPEFAAVRTIVLQAHCSDGSFEPLYHALDWSFQPLYHALNHPPSPTHFDFAFTAILQMVATSFLQQIRSGFAEMDTQLLKTSVGIRIRHGVKGRIDILSFRTLYVERPRTPFPLCLSAPNPRLTAYPPLSMREAVLTVSPNKQ